MLFRTYIDESADMPETVFTVGGFVGHEDTWIDLEPKWLGALPANVGYFHATGCFGGREQFRGMPIPERVKLLDALTNLIVKADVRLIAIGIEVAAYKEFSPKPKSNEFGGNKYIGPFGFVIQAACRDYMSSGHPIPVETDDTCAFFIEDGQWAPSARLSFITEKTFPEDRWWRNRIGTDTYGKKHQDKFGEADVIPLLQVADMGAFLANRFMVNAPDGPIPWRPYFQKLEDAGKLFLQPEVITKRQLEAFYAIHGAIKAEQAGIDIWDEIMPRRKG